MKHFVTAGAVTCALTMVFSIEAHTPTAVFQAHLSQDLTVSQRLTRLENQVQHLSQKPDQADTMREQLADLRGRVETNQHALSALQSQVALLQKQQEEWSASQRLRAATPKKDMRLLVQKQIPLTGKTKDVKAYQQAYQDLLQRHYPQATKAFESFLKAYPKSKLVADAQFWLGDLYLAQGRPDKATQAFHRVANNPQAIKAPDAMYKLGMIFLANGDMAHAKEMFTKVVKNYQGTDVAKLATKQLKNMH